MRLDRGVDKPNRHGRVKIILSSITEPQSLAEKIQAMTIRQTNREAMKAIDKDHTRGGFSSTMRHART